MQMAPRAGPEGKRPASSSAQFLGSRPGHSWEFSGLVNRLPPVYDDEKRVSVRLNCRH